MKISKSIKIVKQFDSFKTLPKLICCLTELPGHSGGSY